MPLVTRHANQGRLFVLDTEPTNSWTDGDIWVDTGSAGNPVFKNSGGTAEPVGEEAALIFG